MIRDQLANTTVLVTHLDGQNGRILVALKKTGQTKPIIVYAADNGLALGSHGLLGKQNVPSTACMPLFIAGPGVPRRNRASLSRICSTCSHAVRHDRRARAQGSCRRKLALDLRVEGAHPRLGICPSSKLRDAR